MIGKKLQGTSMRVVTSTCDREGEKENREDKKIAQVHSCVERQLRPSLL